MEPNKQPPVTNWRDLNALDFPDATTFYFALWQAAVEETKDKDALIAQLREEVSRYKSNCDAYIKVVEQLQQENQRLKEQLTQLEQAHKEEIASVIRSLREDRL